ncbi:MAG: hypothetical protein KJZ86_02520, partial [Caldilineaceae bacterium]|nr:hypothetical protein [Caldilineaceae bacterium]
PALVSLRQAQYKRYGGKQPPPTLRQAQDTAQPTLVIPFRVYPLWFRYGGKLHPPSEAAPTQPALVILYPITYNYT